MRGVVFEKVGDAPKIVSTLEKPEPGPGQILVKSLWTAVNPVDAYMSQYGLLVLSFPLTLGVDASGTISSIHPSVSTTHPNLTPGTFVCGCTRLGSPGYSAGQEYFLMDAALTIPTPSNISAIEAATLGVGIETAALALFDGLGIPLPNPQNLPGKKPDDWIVVLGGASSVGGYAVQLSIAAGYSVIASCSSRSTPSVLSIGASETFDYSHPPTDQLDKVLSVTSGRIHGIIDAAASDDPVLAKLLFASPSYAYPDRKRFATTNDWTGIANFEGGITYAIELGPIGREDAGDLNGLLEGYIPVLAALVEKGYVKTGEYVVVEAPEGKSGWGEGMVEGYRVKNGGMGGVSPGSRKVVVRVAEE